MKIQNKQSNSSLCFLFFCLFYSSFVFAATPVEDLKSLLDPVSTLSGRFNQKVVNEQGKLVQSSSGEVLLKKPLQFRWEIQGDEPRLVVSNGKKLWDYDEDLSQVSVQKISKKSSHVPIFFLTGDANSLDKDFSIKIISSSTSSKNSSACMSESDRCFNLEPKEENGSFQWIKIGFKAQQLKEMEFLDQLGQRTSLVFSGVVLNSAIPEGKFQFKPPKGVDVVTNE